MRLQRLTGLEREKIDEEMKELSTEIAEYLSILGNREKRIMASCARTAGREGTEFAVPRRTMIEESEFDSAIDIEDLIQKEDMVVTVTANGYIKRTPLSAYRAQKPRRQRQERHGCAR